LRPCEFGKFEPPKAKRRHVHRRPCIDRSLQQKGGSPCASGRSRQHKGFTIGSGSTRIGFVGSTFSVDVSLPRRTKVWRGRSVTGFLQLHRSGDVDTAPSSSFTRRLSIWLAQRTVYLTSWARFPLPTSFSAEVFGSCLLSNPTFLLVFRRAFPRG